MRFVYAFLLFSVAGPAYVQEPKKDDTKPKQEFATGYKPAPKEVTDRIHAEAARKHGKRVADLPKVLAPTWDCRALGLVPPIRDQGNCGSCYLFSGCGVVSSALIKAGYWKNDGSGHLSEQYGLDCQRFGGCGGGDESEVVDFICRNGFPSDEYGPYQASSRACKYTNQKLWAKGATMGFCTPGQQWGQARVEDMKNCMVQYGPLSIALDAGGLNGNPGTVSYCTGRGINHAVMLVGWDDSKGKTGAFLMRNSWGKGWGDGGYCWLAYESYIVEAFWVSIAPLPPPNPAPYKLFVGMNQVGAPEGYQDIPTATAAAHIHADTAKVAVDIKDASGKLVATIQPAPGPGPGPSPSPLTPGALLIDWDAKTISAGSNWTISGGKLSESTVDLSGLDPKVADAIRAIVNAERIKAKPQSSLPRDEPKCCGLQNVNRLCECGIDGQCSCGQCDCPAFWRRTVFLCSRATAVSHRSSAADQLFALACAIACTWTIVRH